MKYIGMPAGMWVLFRRSFQRNLTDVLGYDKEVATHMAVAASVASPYIDCGLGVKSAADSMGLDFIEVIKCEKLHKKLDELGGYNYSNLGKIVNI